MDQTKLELIRHDAAHIMAMSVQELYPEGSHSRKSYQEERGEYLSSEVDVWRVVYS